jgi:hypothetical protein
MTERMSKYALARRCLAEVDEGATTNGIAADDCIEALLVVVVEALAERVGRKRAADALRYELSNIGGDVDTVFLRSR